MIYQIEAGIKKPSLDTLKRLADALNVTPNDLLGVNERTETTEESASNEKGNTENAKHSARDAH